jgi:hypothetical protein
MMVAPLASFLRYWPRVGAVRATYAYRAMFEFSLSVCPKPTRAWVKTRICRHRDMRGICWVLERQTRNTRALCFARFLPGALALFAAYALFQVRYKRLGIPQIRCVKALSELLID